MTSLTAYTTPRVVQFSKEQMEKIKECLDELASSTGSWSILLTDTAGQLIDIRGRIDKKNAEALAVLIAGSYAASAEFIKILGKDRDAHCNNFSLETTDYNIFSTIVDEVLILNVAFRDEVKVGIVRVFADEARHTLLEIAREALATNADDKDMNLRLTDNGLNQLLNDEFEKLIKFKA